MSRRAATIEELANIARATPPPEAMLTLEQVAAWLQIGVDAAAALALPVHELSERNPRYNVGEVLRELETRRKRRHPAAVA